MNRRYAIRTAFIFSAGVTLLPSCLQKDTTIAVPLNNIVVNSEQQKMLAQLAATIIPTTKFIGAAEVKAHEFTLMMVDEALPGVNVGDVADELAPRAVGGEVPLHQIRHGRGGRGIRLGRDPERTRLTGDKALGTHDLAHQLRGTLGAFLGQVDMDAAIPVSPIGRFEEVLDSSGQRLSAGRGGRLWAGPTQW